MRMHPDEKTLRTVSQLTPELSELVARMARSCAKDAMQDLFESYNLPFDPAQPGVVTRIGLGHALDRAIHESTVAITTGAPITCGLSTCVVCGDDMIHDPAADDRRTHESNAHCDNPSCTVCGDQS